MDEDNPDDVRPAKGSSDRTSSGQFIRDNSRNPLARAAFAHPALALLAADTAAWLVAFAIANLLRFDFDSSRVSWVGVLVFAGLGSALQAGIGYISGSLRGRYRIASFEEIKRVSITTGYVGLLLFGLDLLLERRTVPLGAVLAGSALALLFMLLERGIWRQVIERELRPANSSTPLLVFGAGEGGTQIVTSLLRTPDAEYRPVALLDDYRPRRQVRGLPVVGGRGSIAEAAAEHEARDLLIAIPSASNALIREIADEATAAGLRMMILPRVDELVDGVSARDIRQLTEADLLQRGEIQTDIDAISGYLSDRVVLVTGAGGSIGSEICRQLSKYNTRRLVMLDRDENGLQATQLSIDGRGLLDGEGLVVADIRDVERIGEVFRDVSPDVVFHAAALKHLPLLEAHPEEGYKTNVLGSLNVLQAALDAGVGHFVNVSTDKAADPTSVLGRTKRAAERLTAHAAAESGRHFISVRFGNVLGSSGSVLPTFRQQIESGGPVTVTDPDVTRFFMTVPEAVQLVVQAGALGTGGEVAVLDMGDPVKIVDMARRLIANADSDSEIVFTGLRPGEKLHEVLFSESENLRESAHPLIKIAHVDPLDPLALSLAHVIRGDDAALSQDFVA